MTPKRGQDFQLFCEYSREGREAVESMELRVCCAIHEQNGMELVFE